MRADLGVAHLNRVTQVLLQMRNVVTTVEKERICLLKELEEHLVVIILCNKESEWEFFDEVKS